ncbi:zinc finger protein 407 [Pholidichthys leucotaenia]
MDKTVASGEAAENDMNEKVQSDDVNIGLGKADKVSEVPQPDVQTGDGDNLCKTCGFLAKCPRSLKIHSARKHGKIVDKNAISDVSPLEIKQEVEMEVESGAEPKEGHNSNHDELKVAATDGSANEGSSNKNQSVPDNEQTHQESEVPTHERRVSKRTPKPKIIYSCNYCGQEFRDKPPLDVHIQRYHTKDTPYTFDADENMDEEEEVMDSVSVAKATPVHIASKRSLNRFQLKCPDCDFRVSTPVVLENHARVKHPDQQWYHCKLCNFFSATSQWMDSHLYSENHTQQQKEKEGSGSSSFECYVERVSRDSVGDGATIDDIAQKVGGEGTAALTEEKEGQGDDEATETAKTVLAEEEELECGPPSKKRGQPKLASLTTCGYCGLVVSNATNLSVHVRRKHSRDYGYSCTLCNYSCVTKGDMDRHCFTKKHVRRVQECANKDPITNHKSVPMQEKTSAQGQDSNTASEITVGDQESDNAALKDQSEEKQTESDTDLPKSKYDSVNACALCDFVAQSIPSLHLHVKRKHTRDFEYVCLSCRYYAVTCREMSRHANTERHKQKSKKYLKERGDERQRALALLVTQKVTRGPGDNSNAECESQSPAESESSDSQGVESQHMSTSAATTEPVDAAMDLAGGAEEEQAHSTPVSADGGPDSSNHQTEPQQVPAEPQLSVHQSEQEEGEGERAEEGESQCGKADGTITDTQLSRAPPFDACIIPLKALAEKEQALQEFLTLEGEASVILLTAGSPTPSGILPPNPSFIKKNKPKELKPREEGKGSSSRIRCEDCGFMADGMSGLNVHISMKHPSKDRHFHCLVCGKSFYSESNLHQHLTSAAHFRNEKDSVEELPEGGASFKCLKCTARFASEQDLFYHIKVEHEELLREVNKYVLEDTEQINREREENQGNVCKYCGKVCKSSNSMAFLAHIRTHTGSKPFICKICNFATAQLGDARNHVKRHLGLREYKCDLCGWAFVMKKHLSTHLLGKHGVGQRKERKFECELCERSFTEKWALNNHMKLHSGEKPYKCVWPSCHYAFLNLSAMKDHYRTHTGEKSYLCDLCGFAGGTRHALTKHRRQHTGERPFKCKLCNFASTTQSHLSRHKRVHTGEKPYRCPWCDYRSNCAENIRKHILHTGKHEGVKMYNCPKCNYATNSPMEFRNHLKENHPDIENPDLAYLHAGIVSKSFECRLKGQGATFVEAESGDSPLHKKVSPDGSSHDESVQQVIIIQGYDDEDVAIDQALEESAAVTLQTLAMAGQVAKVLHITEDGQVIASGREVASAGAHLAGGSTQYIVLESGEAQTELQSVARGEVAATAAAAQSHIVSESSTALDALLSAVSEMGHQEEIQGETAIVHEVLTPEIVEAVQTEVQVEVKEEEEEVQVIQEAVQEDMQEVLQLAASQMMKEGLTQVIVNDEGTHYIVTELDNCTLQVEEGVYGETGAGDGEVQQAEQQAGEEMVVYFEGAPHNIVLEG